jgi:hypothetical protein
LVVVTGAPIAPPPSVTEKEIGTCGTGLPKASTTRTSGTVGSAVPTTSICPSPATKP